MYIVVEVEHFAAAFYRGGPAAAETQLDRPRARSPDAQNHPGIAADQAFRVAGSITFRLKNFVVVVYSGEDSTAQLPKWTQLIRDHMPS